MSNEDLEKPLTELPDEVANALVAWRTATLERERVEALIYLSIKATNDNQTENEIKAMIRVTKDSYEAKIKEISAEAEYTRLNQRLMADKKKASLRTAF